MLHAALTALLALQSASGSPNVAPSPPPSRRPRRPRRSPTPAQARASTNAPSTNPGLPPSSEAPASAEAPPLRAPDARSDADAGAHAAPDAAAAPFRRPKASADQLLRREQDRRLRFDPRRGLREARGRPFRSSRGPTRSRCCADGTWPRSPSYGSKDAPGRFVSIIDLALGESPFEDRHRRGSQPARPEGPPRRAAARDRGRPEGARRRRSPRGQGPRAIPDRAATSRTSSPRPRTARRAYVTSLSRRIVTVIDLQTGKVAQGHSDRQGRRGPRRHARTAARSGSPIATRTRSPSSTSATLAPVFTIRASEFPIRVKITPDGRTADRHVHGNRRRPRLRHRDARREGAALRSDATPSRRHGDARLPQAFRHEPGSGRPADRPRRKTRVRLGRTRRRRRRHRPREDARRRRLDRRAASPTASP